MTRDEFINDIQSWEELINFCDNNDCDICDDIYDESGRDDLLNERLQEKAGEVARWQELWEWLDNIPEDSDYYREAGYYDFEPVDNDDFDSYKEEVLEWADDNDIWDEEEEAEEDEEDPVTSDGDEDADDGFTAEAEPISIGELMTVCNSQIQKITENTAEDTADGEQRTAVSA